MNLDSSTLGNEYPSLDRPELEKNNPYKEVLLWTALATLSLSMIFLLFVNFIEWVIARL